MLQTRERVNPSPGRIRVSLPSPAMPRELPPLPRPAEDVVVCAGWQGQWPAVLVATARRVYLVTMPHGEPRITGITIRQVLGVEEHREGKRTELTVLTTRSTIVVSRIAAGNAWSFCRAVRRAILEGR